MIVWTLLFAAISAAGTAYARRYAIARQLIDAPGERRSHSVDTPRGGGIAIVLAVLIAALALSMRFPEQATLLRLFAAGFAIVAAAGWLDDHRETSPWWRLAAHAVAAMVLAAGVALWQGDPWLALAAFVAALALTNVWNFMDGINGLAASQAAGVAAVFAWATGGAWGWLGAALAAACVGFLPFNFPRARIFLGDVGSGAIGYALATLAVVVFAHGGLPGPLALLPLSAFLVDAGMTLMGRILRRERWWTAHTLHAYQRWAARSDHGRVTIAYGAWTGAAVALSIALRDAPPLVLVLCTAAWYTCAALLWLLLQRYSRGGAGESAGRDGAGRRSRKES